MELACPDRPARLTRDLAASGNSSQRRQNGGAVGWAAHHADGPLPQRRAWQDRLANHNEMEGVAVSRYVLFHCRCDERRRIERLVVCRVIWGSRWRRIVARLNLWRSEINPFRRVRGAYAMAALAGEADSSICIPQSVRR